MSPREGTKTLRVVPSDYVKKTGKLKKNVNLMTRVDKCTKNRLSKAAKEKGVSMHSFLRGIISNALNE